MSFHASNNRIYMKNQAGSIVFDTQRKMPAIVGSLSGSARLIGPNGFHDVVNVIIGYADPKTEFIFPTLLVSSKFGGQFSNGGMPFSAPGTFLLYAIWTDQGKFYSYGVLTVINEGGVIILRARGRILSGDGWVVQYKVYLGRFI